MTQSVPDGVDAARPDDGPDAVLARLLAEEAARHAKAADLRPRNKAALFDVLARAGIATVTIDFDGFGDSGQIERIEARDAAGEAVALPQDTLTLVAPGHDATCVTRGIVPPAEAIEALCYELLEETHAGWETNEGAYGVFVFDAVGRTISLEHNERYEAIERSTHDW